MSKRTVILTTALVFAFLYNTIGQTSTSVVKYVSQYKTLANNLAAKYGIPPNVIMAIAMIESSCGAGKTAKVLNNHFGIVGKNHVSYKSRYKQYCDASESYEDFCKTISHKKFYSDLKNNPDSKMWVKKISESGYSEAPKVWSSRVISTISTNRL